MNGKYELKPVPGIKRQDGVTGAERYLKRLCEHTFLSLWSYAGLYRDQGQTAKSREGKEVCDLLVVFEEHIIIFSDKDCQFPQSGNQAIDWSRWFRRAVLKSAEQVWGAERWIKAYPDRLFLDRSCTQRFPIDMPDPRSAKFHRVVVAHDASRRCREAFGGSGSLMIAPGIVGPSHYEGAEIRPFAIGQIDPPRGYIHVFDDTSLTVVLKTLDTITDLVRYLTKKECLIESGQLLWAAGEDDLLAYYLGRVNEKEEHYFRIPPGCQGIYVDEGFWENFQNRPERRAQIEADRISYLWDQMIERSAGHLVAGTGLSNPGSTVGEQEKIFRLMAREPRLRRRMLAEAVVGLIEKTPVNRPLERATRIFAPTYPGDPCYVFLLLAGPEGEPPERFRRLRRHLLEMLCMVAKLDFPDVQAFVGYATDPGLDAGQREEILYLDMRDWTAEKQAEAQEIREEFGLLKKVERFGKTVYEYPPAAERHPKGRGTTLDRRPARGRNSPCPCGSGRKFKRCCLRRH